MKLLVLRFSDALPCPGDSAENYYQGLFTVRPFATTFAVFRLLKSLFLIIKGSIVLKKKLENSENYKEELIKSLPSEEYYCKHFNMLMDKLQLMISKQNILVCASASLHKAFNLSLVFLVA